MELQVEVIRNSQIVLPADIAKGSFPALHVEFLQSAASVNHVIMILKGQHV